MAPSVEVEHAIADLSDGRRLATPFWRVRSDREGPSLLVVAAQHGNEVQGAEVIRRFTALCADSLVAGEAWLVPFMNLSAMGERRNSAGLGPEEKGTERALAANMNRLWPGDPGGGDVERVAYALHQAIVWHCTHCIDLHCWNRFWATATLATDDSGESRAMGEVAGTRFVRWDSPPETSDPPAQIRTVVMRRGGAGMAMELAGQYVVIEREVRTGLRGVTNVARMLGMLEGDPDLALDTGIEVRDDNTVVVEAPCSGLFVAEALQLEDRVEAGQRLGHIIRDEDLATVEVTAPAGGWLWRFGSHRPDPDVKLPDQHPYSDPGDPLASIVTG